MEFTHEDEKLIRLACAYVVLVIQIWLAPGRIILLLIYCIFGQHCWKYALEAIIFPYIHD